MWVELNDATAEQRLKSIFHLNNFWCAQKLSVSQNRSTEEWVAVSSSESHTTDFLQPTSHRHKYIRRLLSKLSNLDGGGGGVRK